jgi:hypothetical protein
LHADDQKWQPNDDLAYYDTIEPDNEFGHNIDLEDAPSGSDFNIYDIEEEPMESPPTESMLKKSKNYSFPYPPSVFHQKKGLAGAYFPQDRQRLHPRVRIHSNQRRRRRGGSEPTQGGILLRTSHGDCCTIVQRTSGLRQLLGLVPGDADLRQENLFKPDFFLFGKGTRFLT